MIRRILLFLLLVGWLSAQESLLWATKIKPLNLEKLAESAGAIFEGRCVDIRTGKDPETGLISTWYTFAVLDGLKGNLEETFTFKQYGGKEGDIVLKTQSVTYSQGEVAILFLYPKSTAGFTSSVGMGQGKFSIQDNPNQQSRYVTNGMPAMVLFEEMEESIATLDEKGFKAQGQARLRSSRMNQNEFKSLVRQIVKSQQLEKK